ncbi:MAG TPA: hypothetical protein VG870_13695 [Chitinophagaceae bacterium]|nr:hypothetical protein [Chitinophagaceae bacterium]
MNYTIMLITSFSILLPAIAGIVRYRKIDPSFRPFLILVWIGLANELLSVWVAENGHSNAINSNIYVLVESLMITWQFRRWGNFERVPRMFYLLVAILIAGWGLENFYFFSIRSFSSWFRILYSLIIVLMSVHQINRLILRERGAMLKNPVFLICLGFIVYFTYKAIIETFWVYGLNTGREFRINVYLILAWINFLVNCIFALAILWIPTKLRFTLPS